jgi:hypothetical protein
MSPIELRIRLLSLASETLAHPATPHEVISAAKLYSAFVFDLQPQTEAEKNEPDLEPSQPKIRKRKNKNDDDGLSGEPEPVVNPLAKAKASPAVADYKDLQEAMVALVEKGEMLEKGKGRKLGGDVLAQFGVKFGSELQPEQWAECIDILKAEFDALG